MKKEFFPTMKTVNESADLELDRILKDSAVHPMTADELFEQKVRFIHARMSDRTITEDDVRRHLKAKQ